MASKVITMFLVLATIPCFAQSNLLQIVSPRSGTVVHPGETVVIAVSADRSVSNVAIIGYHPLGFSQRTNGQGLQFLLSIPSNITIGAYDVSAVGSASDGSLAASPPISLQVDIPKSRFTITTEPSVLRFSAPGEAIPVHVVGTFADGSQLDVTHSTQMSYSSQNPQIATVDGQGIVTAMGLGSTYIRVSNTDPSYSYFLNTTVGQLARMVSPGVGSMLSSSSVMFRWNGSSEATAYRIDVGSKPGGNDYYQSGSLPTTTFSQAVTGLPINGDAMNPIYVTLWTRINGKWAKNEYKYTLFYEPDFTISASPSSLTIRKGQQGTSTVTTKTSGQFARCYQNSITLSASGLPSGTTAGFSRSTIPGGASGSSTLTLTLGSTTPVGTYRITVTGDGCGLQHTAPITLTCAMVPGA